MRRLLVKYLLHKIFFNVRRSIRLSLIKNGNSQRQMRKDIFKLVYITNHGTQFNLQFCLDNFSVHKNNFNFLILSFLRQLFNSFFENKNYILKIIHSKIYFKQKVNAQCKRFVNCDIFFLICNKTHIFAVISFFFYH